MCVSARMALVEDSLEGSSDSGQAMSPLVHRIVITVSRDRFENPQVSAMQILRAYIPGFKKHGEVTEYGAIIISENICAQV